MSQLAEESSSEKRSDGDTAPDLGEPPYLGLATFEQDDAERFFGRERLIAELCERIAGTPFLALFAPSGAGKSSLLRAGLIPAVTKGAVSGGEEWVTVLLTPGADPVGELAIHLANQFNAAAAPLRDSLAADPDSVGLTVRQILAGKPPSARLMLVVDQFEEVFMLCQQEEQRVQFIDLLLAATREPRARDTSGRADPVILNGHDGTVWTAEVSPDGRSAVSVGTDDTLRVWDLDGGGEPLVRKLDSPTRYVTFSPDGQRLATASRDGTVRIWDATGSTDPLVMRGHEGLVWAVAFSPDGERVASAGSDGTVRIWSLSHPDKPLVLAGHQGFVWYVAFSPDGQWVASTGKDSTVRVWRTDVAAAPVTYKGFGASVEQIRFAPDSQRLVTCHDDGTVRVWRCDACRPIGDVLRDSEGGVDAAEVNRPGG